MRPLRTLSCSSNSYRGRRGSVTALLNSPMASLYWSSGTLYPSITVSRVSRALRILRWALSTGAPSNPLASSREGLSSLPEKTSALVTESGLSSARFAMRSPGRRAAPSLSFQLITPDSGAVRGMNIFITSTSAKGSPAFTCSPSGTRERTSFPATSAVSLVGSYSLVKMHVLLSKMRRWPVASSVRYAGRDLPPRFTRYPPSLSARQSLCTYDPLHSTVKVMGPLCDTFRQYLTSW
mmetsp:Transcript_3232/g.4718  ORF Transcript_3232/g.4718 Transcript_3232/m.4718 type:complete len:237 (-) Transcript_3232:1787-2497(-)